MKNMENMELSGSKKEMKRRKGDQSVPFLH